MQVRHRINMLSATTLSATAGILLGMSGQTKISADLLWRVRHSYLLLRTPKILPHSSGFLKHSFLQQQQAATDVPK